MLRNLTRAVTVVPVVAFLAACRDRAPTDVSAARPDVPQASGTRASVRRQHIRMLDQCEPKSFNRAIGPGTCVGEGKVTFARFLRVLRQTKRVETWRFAPNHFPSRPGMTLVAHNRGGEVHTFTRV